MIEYDCHCCHYIYISLHIEIIDHINNDGHDIDVSSIFFFVFIRIIFKYIYIYIYTYTYNPYIHIYIYMYTYIHIYTYHIYTHHIYIHTWFYPLVLSSVSLMMLVSAAIATIAGDRPRCPCNHSGQSLHHGLASWVCSRQPMGFGTLGLWDWNAWRKGDSNYKLWDFMDIWCSIPRVLANPGVCPWFLSMFLQSFSAPNIQPPMAGGDRIASATSDQELGEDHDRCLGWCHAQCRVANCGFNKSYVFHHL